MRTRRGTSYWPGTMAGHINAFAIGDIVISTIVGNDNFYGIVKEVQPKLNKVMVAWGGGSMCQHDPEEIQLSVHQNELVKARMASRRGRLSMDEEQAEKNPQFVGDPKINGIDKPRGGGFSIMQDLAKDQKQESLEKATGNPKVSPIQATSKTANDVYILYTDSGHGWLKVTREELERLGIENKITRYSYEKGEFVYLEEDLDFTTFKRAKKQKGEQFAIREVREPRRDSPIRNYRSFRASEMKSRRAMYWCGPGRKYRMTKSETASGTPRCPKCCSDMGKHPYTRCSKLYICEECGFKISSNDVLSERNTIEAIPAEPEVTMASLKSR